MAGFFDEYGAGDERRARNIKLIAVSVLVAAVLTGLLYFFLRNYRQEQQAKRFSNCWKPTIIRQPTICGSLPTRTATGIP